MEILIPITFFVCVTAVLIFRPLTKRVGGLLEVMTRERAPVHAEDPAAARTLLLVEQVSRRLDLIEERLDFNERLLAQRTDRRQLQHAPLAGTEYAGR